LQGLASAGYIPKYSQAVQKALFGGTMADLRDYLQEFKTIEQQKAEAVVQSAQGFTNTIGAYIDNPSAVASGIAETLPSTVGGARIGIGGAKVLSTIFPKLA